MLLIVFSVVQIAWREASFGRYFMNTILITVGTVVITLVVTSSAGYVLARTPNPVHRRVRELVAEGVDDVADARQAALALVTGLAANRAFDTGQPVRTADVLTF